MLTIQEIKNNLIFLSRTPMKGEEAAACHELQIKLQLMKKELVDQELQLQNAKENQKTQTEDDKGK